MEHLASRRYCVRHHHFKGCMGVRFSGVLLGKPSRATVQRCRSNRACLRDWIRETFASFLIIIQRIGDVEMGFVRLFAAVVALGVSSWISTAAPSIAQNAEAATAPGEGGHAAQQLAVQPLRFREVPGRVELTGELIAKPRTGPQLAQPGPFAQQVAPAVQQVAAEALAPYAAVGGIEFSDGSAHVIRVPAHKSEGQVAAELMATGAFEYVHPNYRVFHTGACVNDARFDDQWHHAPEHLDSCAGWSIFGGDPRVSVAIVDTGVDVAHTDLDDRALDGYNSSTGRFESEGGDIADTGSHGTQVAGMAAGEGGNGFGISGSAPDISYRPVRASQNGQSAELADLINGALTAIRQGDRAANVSFSGGDTQGARDAGAEAKLLGGLLVWAAGNSTEEMTVGNRDDDDLIVVGATDMTGGLASFSNFGRYVDLTAPGDDVFTSTVGGGFSSVYGTSFATPIVTGIAGLIFSADPSLTPDEVEQILKNSIDDLGEPGVDDQFGYGRINTAKVVEQLEIATVSDVFPVEDSVPSASIDPQAWSDIEGADVVANPFDAPADPFALALQGGDAIATIPTDASAVEDTLTVSFDVLPRNTEPSDRLEVSLPPFFGEPIGSVEAGDLSTERFTRVRFGVPNRPRLFGIQARFEALGSGDDEWLIDNVRFGRFNGLASAPLVDDFEGELDTVLRWDIAGSLPAFPSGGAVPGQIIARRFSESSLLQSFPIDLENADVAQGVEVIAEASGDSAGDLVVQMQRGDGAFVDVLRVPAAHASQFDAFAAILPQDVLTDGSPLRVQLENASGGFWLLEQLALGIEVDAPCSPADTAPPFGTVNGDDVTAFLAAFGSGGQPADLADPKGVLDGADVNAFITAFGAGCP